MSRQSKNARNLERARQISMLHKDGKKGPAKTNPKHGKRWGYRTNPDVIKRIAEQAKAAQTNERTSGKKLLEGAGNAARE